MCLYLRLWCPKPVPQLCLSSAGAACAPASAMAKGASVLIHGPDEGHACPGAKVRPEVWEGVRASQEAKARDDLPACPQSPGRSHLGTVAQ